MQTGILQEERQEENGGGIVRKKILIILLCVLAVLAMGLRRYGPNFWRSVAGGIELVSGNVTMTSGDLTLTSGNIKSSTDVHYALKTVIKTVDCNVGNSTDDFQFDDTAANQSEQSVDLGEIVPAYAEVVSVQLRCFETVTSSGAMSIDLGLAAGDAEYLAAANIDTANDIDGTATGAGPKLEASNAARKVFINGTPDANWNTLVAGRWSVIVTYIDYGAVQTEKNP